MKQEIEDRFAPLLGFAIYSPFTTTELAEVRADVATTSPTSASATVRYTRYRGCPSKSGRMETTVSDC